MSPPTDAETRADWTFRRLPGAIARGLVVAATAAVLLFIAHIGGWGLLERFDRSVLGAGLAFGMPVALLTAFLVAAPMLRRLARRGRLTRARATRLGALFYGGIVFLWMIVVGAGPPDAVLIWMHEAALSDAAVAAITLGYRHLATPLAFAVYGAIAARIGWAAAFGGRAEAPAELVR